MPFADFLPSLFLRFCLLWRIKLRFTFLKSLRLELLFVFQTFDKQPDLRVEAPGSKLRLHPRQLLLTLLKEIEIHLFPCCYEEEKKVETRFILIPRTKKPLETQTEKIKPQKMLH